MHTKKYELYCGKCNKIFGYTDHLFQSGDVLEAKYIQYPNGSDAKDGDTVFCGCPRGTGAVIKSRENICLS